MGPEPCVRAAIVPPFDVKRSVSASRIVANPLGFTISNAGEIAIGAK